MTGARDRVVGREAGQAGFTLVEVLVAFALTALGTIVALEAAGMTARGARRVEAARVAADEAEAVVLRRVAAGDLRPGLTQGRFSDGAPWTLGVSDARAALGLAPHHPAARPGAASSCGTRRRRPPCRSVP